MSRNLICIPLFNGVCNRLIPLLSVMRIAEKTNRKIEVFWTERPGRSCIAYYGKGCEFDQLFEPISGVEFVSQEVLNTKIGGSDFYDFNYFDLDKAVVKVDTKNTIFIIFAITAIFTDKDEVSDFEKYKLKITGRFDKDPVFLGMHDVCSKYLRPVKHLQDQIDEVKTRFSDKMIGIHLRRTDGMFAESDWTETDSKLIGKISKWIRSGYKIFLATDSFDHEKKIKNLFGKNIIVYTPNVFKFENNDDNVVSSIVDLFLLSKCKIIIGTTGSSFSLTSSIISDVDVPLWYVSPSPDTVDCIDI